MVRPNNKAKGEKGAQGGWGSGAGSGELVKGFRLLRLPLKAGSPISRNLLVKRNGGRNAEQDPAADRTLFVSHLDGLVTESQLSRSFSTGFGPVEKVELKCVEKRAAKAEQRADRIMTRVNFARVVFQEQASVEKALKASTGHIVGSAVLPAPMSELKASLKACKSLYREPAELRKEVDNWMVNFDARQEEEKRIARENAVDDDGFTKVISGVTRTDDGCTIRAAKRPAPLTGAFAEPIKGGAVVSEDPDAAAAAAGGNRKRKKKSKEMPDFYRFQMREQRRQDVIDHRKQKAEDEEKVARMRTHSKKGKPLKPYLMVSSG